VLKHPASQQTRWLEGPIIDSAKELLTRLEQELPTGTFEQSFERGQSRDLEEVIANLIDTSRRG